MREVKNIKVIIAPDSFKGSLSADQVAVAIEAGIKKVIPHVQTVLVPLADGGEGTMNSLVTVTNGRKVKLTVTGPVGVQVEAEYGWLGDGKTCVIELAAASGIGLVPHHLLNPLITTTYGTGELIKAALNEGCRNFIIALGGSATVDGGIGMLQALGMRLLNASGEPIGLGGGQLGKITIIDDSQFDNRIAESLFLIASDVNSPLVGPSGAAYIFGPQKGATAQMVETLDRDLHYWADLIAKKTGTRIHHLPGAGAAGGIGGMFHVFFPARFQRGIDVVIQYTELSKALCGADVVFTGEGQVDRQTLAGKTALGVAQEANRQGICTIVLAGSIGKGIEELYDYGIISIHSVVSGPMSLQEAMEQTGALLSQSAEQVMRTFIANQSLGEKATKIN